MQPPSQKDLLTNQRDLLIRQSKVADDDSAPQPVAPVKLERFQALEHVIRDNPITADPYLELAKIYMEQSRPADARRVLDLAVARFPEVEEVNYLREEAQLTRSHQLLKQVLEDHKAEPTVLTEEAVRRSQTEMNVLKEQVCRARLQRHPDKVELYIPLAAALDFLGKNDEAIVCLEKAAALPEHRATAALQLGHMLSRAGRVPEALSAYRRAALFRIPAPPSEVKLQALHAAADLAEQSGLVDSARRYVQFLVELKPSDQQLADRLRRLQATPL